MVSTRYFDHQQIIGFRISSTVLKHPVVASGVQEQTRFIHGGDSLS